MQSPTIPFRLPPARLAGQLAQFNARKEVQWFGFAGELRDPGSAMVAPAR